MLAEHVRDALKTGRKSVESGLSVFMSVTGRKAEVNYAAVSDGDASKQKGQRNPADFRFPTIRDIRQRYSLARQEYRVNRVKSDRTCPSGLRLCAL